MSEKSGLRISISAVVLIVLCSCTGTALTACSNEKTPKISLWKRIKSKYLLTYRPLFSAHQYQFG